MASMEGMETFEARLASYEITLPGTKRRASNAKGTKPITWPHTAPSPTDMASAGFFYKPSPTSPDNTVCFMCLHKLDGWEEDDDPLAEHLKYSSKCAWALVLSVGLGDLVDPTTTQMVDARRETFAGRWPHDGKRGWVCKTEKMVEGGWHYAPTPDSDDFVTCAQCNLSLDGWEPKDNPFEEHYRRSPECRFFEFAGTTAPKATKGKKGRASKASRLSTQSNMTAVSEAPSIPDFEDSIDETSHSQDTLMALASKASGKGGKAAKKGKSKASKSQAVSMDTTMEDSSIIEILNHSPMQPPPKKGKKRGSEQISSDDGGRGERESTARPEPAAKRRNTRSRASVAEEVQYPELANEASVIEEQPAPAPARGGRKRASSRARKISTASKASLRAGIPDDSAIEAALAAELEGDLSDEEGAKETPAEVTEPKTNPRGKKNNASASTASVRQAPPPSIEPEEALEKPDESMQNDEESRIKEDEKPKKKGKATKAKGKKKAVATTPTEDDATEMKDAEMKVAVVINQEASNETTATKDEVPEPTEEAEVTELPKPKRVAKKKAAGRPKKQKKAAEPDMIDGNDATMEESRDREETQSIHDMLDAMPLPPSSAAKPTPKASKKTKPPQRNIPGAFEPEPESIFQPSSPPAQTSPPAQSTELEDTAAPVAKEATPTPSPQRVQQAVTPSPSPQPSDAENQPPSSRPSASRPPLMPISPGRSQTIRIPLATTPKQSPSKLNRPIGGLSTTQPWSSVDVEMIFAQTPGAVDKENFFTNVNGSLTSPEKKMTVEDWISHLAQKTEGQLKDDCERVVGIFEKEGSRAMMSLEGIECIE